MPLQIFTIRKCLYLYLIIFQLVVQLDTTLTYRKEIDDELIDYDIVNKLKSSRPISSNGTLNSQMINDEIEDNTWNYMAELILILLLAFFTIPANCFLFLFHTKKIYHYKKWQSPLQSTRYRSITNSFHTYLIEICLFDTIIVLYLVSNTLFQFFFYLKKTEYESVFDISNFACKFFIYVLRISGAMSNYLVLLLSLNRCMLIYFRYEEQKELDTHRICFNTKYLTIFLFCICTIANVFRLELLTLQTSSPTNTPSVDLNLNNIYSNFGNLSTPHLYNQLNITLETNDDLIRLTQDLKNSECGPNIGSIMFIMGNSVHNKLFWSIIIYNVVFVIIPVIGNFILSVYLIHVRSKLKAKLDILIFLKKNQLNFLIENEASDSNNLIDVDLHVCKHYRKLNQFHIEFLKTCTPCIAFSLTHVILFLPYSIIDTINQVKPYISFMVVLQYMTYVRYIFYCCKFYLLLLVSYKFRKEFREFFRIANCKK